MTGKRKAAPDVKVNTVHVDERKAQLDELNEENPEFVHSYQSQNLFGPNSKQIEWEMKVKGQEVVKGEDGEPMHHMGDPVVRQERKAVEARLQAEGDRSREAVESVVKTENSTVKRNPRQPPKQGD